jgi:putative glycosyltransferase (TIGR04348 family)
MTALRWKGFLEKSNYAIRVSEAWSGKPTELLIALHAFRSHPSIALFRKAHPDKPIVLIMTGTDLYRDMPSHPEVIQSMQMVDAIVVLQSAALDLIPSKLKKKTQLIHQSVKPILRKPLLKRDFLVSVIGHLRIEKDPFCLARSLAFTLPESNLRVVHLGKAMSPEMRKQALGYSKRLKRYQWLGELSHAKTLQVLSRSHLMVISSIMEGGAHVVSEAIAIGVPVIASDIPGNRGLLGENYPAYFPVGDATALGQLLQKAETSSTFYQSLVRHIRERQKYTRPESEMRSITTLAKCLLNGD